MKKLTLLIAVAVVILFLGVTPGLAATPEEIEASITSGLVWLVDQQAPDGSWGSYYGEGVGYTGFALLKLEDRAYELGYDSPFDPAYEYALNVEAGFDYLFDYYHVMADSNGDGINEGYFDMGGYHQTYCTSIGLMAIASSGDPDRVVASTNPAANGKTFQQIAEECVNWLIVTQNPDGGWRYVPLDTGSDQSNTGWATMGLAYANVNFGIDITAAYPGLQNWVDIIQTKTAGSLYGGSQYTPGGGWENTLKTGSLLYQFAMLSTPVTDPDVQDAIGFIEYWWEDTGGCGYGWMNHRQAMFCLMKGLEAYNIELLDLDGDDIPETDWFDVVSTHLVGTQNADGSWPWDCWASQEASTAWALLTLERTVVKPIPYTVEKDFRFTAVDFTPVNCGDDGICGTADDYLMPADLGMPLPDADADEKFEVKYIINKKGEVTSTNPGQLYGVITIMGIGTEFITLNDMFTTQFDVNPGQLGGGVEILKVDADGYAEVLTDTTQITSASVDNDAGTVDLVIDLENPLAVDEKLMIYIKYQTALKFEAPDFDDFVNIADVTVNEVDLSATATVEFF